jgi:hypothetical protein
MHCVRLLWMQLTGQPAPSSPNVEILPTRIRWLAVGAGSAAGFCNVGLTLIFPIFSFPLILGAIVQPRSGRSGRWLVWVGALLLSPSVIFDFVAIVHSIRTWGLYRDAIQVTLFVLCIVTVLLFAWLGAELAFEAIGLRRTRARSEEPNSLGGELCVWLVAVCLTVWVAFPMHDPRAFLVFLRSSDLASVASVVPLQLAVLALDLGLANRAVKQWRAHGRAAGSTN